jgi:hypothetical protein
MQTVAILILCAQWDEQFEVRKVSGICKSVSKKRYPKISAAFQNKKLQMPSAVRRSVRRES